MATIALIGSDGAGKTTIAKMVQKGSPWPIKYLYMGINIESSNIVLPTSRLIDFLNRKFSNKSINPVNPEPANKQPQSYRPKCARKFRAAARLFYRLSEEWYRQLVSWLYQLRGYLVIYDRHFIYDFDCDIANHDSRNEPLSERLHRRLLANYYPRPDLVIYLDASPQILLSRKPESPASYLEARQKAFNKQRYANGRIIRVDASQSLETTYREVMYHLSEFFRLQSQKKIID